MRFKLTHKSNLQRLLVSILPYFYVGFGHSYIKAATGCTEFESTLTTILTLKVRLRISFIRPIPNWS